MGCISGGKCFCFGQSQWCSAAPRTLPAAAPVSPLSIFSKKRGPVLPKGLFGELLPDTRGSGISLVHEHTKTCSCTKGHCPQTAGQSSPVPPAQCLHVSLQKQLSSFSPLATEAGRHCEVFTYGVLLGDLCCF